MERRRAQVEKLAKQETVKVGMTHIIIRFVFNFQVSDGCYLLESRASNHDYETGRDSASGIKTGAYVPAPNHFTLHMSRSKDAILLSGHIYTNRDTDNIPTMVTPLKERPVDSQGFHERSVALFIEGRPGTRYR
jgi:hypothetical protein